MFISEIVTHGVMGFKKTSDTIAVSFGVPESAANTFTEEEISLQLDVLNNEIFVVLAIDLNLTPPDAIAATDTAIGGSVTSTAAPTAALQNLSNTNCLATARDFIRAGGFVDSGVGFSRAALETYDADLDYIGLIATNNFFVQVIGTNNAVAKGVEGRVWGYRAKADASTYAALVQSEVLSA
tara:strand:- start:728 stop:1273 length:546 start_codon:yes stop_codon:yes gene_type:complete